MYQDTQFVAFSSNMKEGLGKVVMYSDVSIDMYAAQSTLVLISLSLIAKKMWSDPTMSNHGIQNPK